MRHIVHSWILFVVLAPAMVVGQPISNGHASDPADPHADPAEAYVVLHTGEVIEGSVEVIAVRGVPEHIVVNETSFPYSQVRSYRTNGTVYGIVQAGEPRPMLVVRQSNGAASVYRHVDREGVSSDFFQVADGPIRMASTANLRQAFADHPGAMGHLNRERFLGYTAVGAVVVGAGMIATGAVLELGDIDGPNGVKMGLTGVGIAALVTAIVAPARNQARRAAIRAYNN